MRYPVSSMIRSFQVRSFHSIVRSFHKNVSSFHIFFFTKKSHVKFSKCVIVIWVQSNDRNIDESIFRTIYIIVRACVRALISLRIAERCQSVCDSSESLINDESSFTWSSVCVDPNYFIFPYMHLSIDPCKHSMLNSDSLY